MNEENEINPVQIGIRVRPLKYNEKSVLIHDPDDENNKKLIAIADKAFVFDQIFNENDTQEILYNDVGKPLINKFLKGYNCSVLAYGQTGTGKTYTMIGNHYDSSEIGLISRSIDHVFALAPWNENKNNIQIEISFIEIYKQKVYNLLGKNCSPLIIKNLKIEPSQFIEIKYSDEAHELLKLGTARRHVGETKLNIKSSRSHAIFTIKCTIKNETTTRVSKLNLVDLGGSENVKRTGNVGVALQEGIHINQSLLTLRQVLIALTKNDKVIPFRETLLTTLLHDSLTVKNYITLIACVSPSSSDYIETLTTLRFAESAKQIKSRPEIENIFTNFKVQNPLILEKVNSSLPGLCTPLKRHNSTISTPGHSTNKKLFSSGKKTHSMFDLNWTSNKKQYPSKCEIILDIDEENISTSTVIEPEHNYSPLVSKFTKAIEDKLDRIVSGHVNNIYKTRRSTRLSCKMSTTPENKENVNDYIVQKVMDTLNIQIPKLIDEKFLQFSQKHINAERKAISESALPRKLFSDDIEDDQENTVFKMPSLPVKKKVRQVDKEENNTSVKLRRSTRLSVLSMKIQSPEIETTSNKTNLKRKSTVPIDKPSKYSRLSPLTQHKNMILDTLNNGKEKELVKLACIGQKTAYQIITYRNLNGTFRSIKALENASFWRGQQYKRFMVGNQLPID